MQRVKYLMNGFAFQHSVFARRLGGAFEFDLVAPETKKYVPGASYIPRNFALMRRLLRSGELGKYGVLHYNNTENFLNFRPSDKQVSVCESHGFDFGVNYARFLRDEKNPAKRAAGWAIDKLLGWKIREKIRQFDVYYCSTPDMLEPLRRLVRPDVEWLPNAIDAEKFSPEGPVIRLPGEPACFFPTRLHGDKKPEVAIAIFQDVIKPRFPGATLHLLNVGFEAPAYREKLKDPATYFWHDFMDKDTLAAKIRGSDLCFGDFSIGGLSLMPMQIMACGKPIVTWDEHEIVKIPKDGLPALAQKLLTDGAFAQEYAVRNRAYVVDKHSERQMCLAHLRRLAPLLKSKLGADPAEMEKTIT